MAPAQTIASDRLLLRDVTLCAVTSVNIAATLLSLERCLAAIEFGACKIFVDQPTAPRHPAIEVVEIARLGSSAQYSRFILTELSAHIHTTHCLIVQWDGHVLDARRWRHEFLDFDYVGARWPQFDDGHDVGNGGFSLRSRRLMKLCGEPDFVAEGAEDVAICRTNRAWLENQGMRFAPAELADQFSTERAGRLDGSFGYHGVFNMPRALGARSFHDIVRGLDDWSTVWHDLGKIIRLLVLQPGGAAVAAHLAWTWATRPRR